jgi:mannitol-specific phosphotransferase system IIBC component
MVRYSLLRILVFFGVLSLLWLLGMRGRDQQIPLLVISALVSMVLSYFVLARFREESTQKLQAAVERRAAARQERAADPARSDEAAEDAETAQREDGADYR